MNGLPGDDRVARDLPVEVQEGVHRAVRESLIAGPLPEFGSFNWLQLDVDDPRRLHAIVRAALVWWSSQVFGSAIPEPVVVREISARMKSAAESVSAAYDWRAHANRPTQAQVQRRRDAAASAVFPPAPADLQRAFEAVETREAAA
jgi:hypothetical protein